MSSIVQPNELIFTKQLKSKAVGNYNLRVCHNGKSRKLISFFNFITFKSKNEKGKDLRTGLFSKFISQII